MARQLSEAEQIQNAVHREMTLAGATHQNAYEALTTAQIERFKAEGISHDEASAKALETLKEPSARAAAIAAMRVAAPRSFIRPSWAPNDFMGAYKQVVKAQDRRSSEDRIVKRELAALDQKKSRK